MLFNSLKFGSPLGFGGGASLTDVITNGGFDSDTAWTKGTGWTIAGGVAVGTAASAGNGIVQVPSTPLVAGRTYTVTFTLVATIGGVAFAAPDGDAYGTARTSSGTYEETFVATANDVGVGFGIAADTDFTGTIDNVSVTT